MNFVLQPWQLLVVILTGWLNRQQQAVIDFLLTEVHVLKETHGGKRIPLSDDQRRRLAGISRLPDGELFYRLYLRNRSRLTSRADIAAGGSSRAKGHECGAAEEQQP